MIFAWISVESFCQDTIHQLDMSQIKKYMTLYVYILLTKHPPHNGYYWMLLSSGGGGGWMGVQFCTLISEYILVYSKKNFPESDGSITQINACNLVEQIAHAVLVWH